MAKSKEEFDKALRRLSSSQNEEEVVSRLTFIVKGFSSFLYRDTIASNPYYRDIFAEIREGIIDDLEILKNSLNKEIESIDNNVKNAGAEAAEMKETWILLKSRSMLLLSELESKIEEIMSVI